MRLSVIVPAYNEEKTIRKYLSSLISDLTKLEYGWEIVVVSDGSTDGTLKELKKIQSPFVKIFHYPKNQGKGFALSHGVKKSKGEIVTFLDAGGDFDPSHINRFIKLMEALDADIVIGSKRHPMSKVNYPPKRRFYSWLYQILIRILFNLKVRDTQTGLKVFRRGVLEEILPRALVKQYAFDLELLVIAKHLGFDRITEGPVNMEFNLTSTGINLKTIKNILLDTAAIFYRLYIKRWYNKEHKKEKK